MKRNALFLTGLFLMASMQSCKQEDTPDKSDPNPENKTNTELLTEGKWRLEAGTISPPAEVEIFNTKVTIDNYWTLIALLQEKPDVDDCVKDNLMLFNTDSTITLDDGASKCDPNDPQTEDGGTWAFEADETKILFTQFPFDPLKEARLLDIVDLSVTNLELKMDYELINPVDQSSSSHVINLDFVNESQ